MAGETPVGSYDATDPEAEKRARREQEIQRGNDFEVVRFLLGTKARRSWLYRKLEACHIYGNSFQGEETHKTAFALGQENIGKQLMLEASDASSELYMLMMKEAKTEEARREQLVRDQNEKREAGIPPPRAEDQVPALPPPEGWPGYVPPATPSGTETK